MILHATMHARLRSDWTVYQSSVSLPRRLLAGKETETLYSSVSLLPMCVAIKLLSGVEMLDCSGELGDIVRVNNTSVGGAGVLMIAKCASHNTGK